MMERCRASIRTISKKIADKKRQKQPRPSENHVHSQMPVLDANVQCASLVAKSTSIPQFGGQEERAEQGTPHCSRRPSDASCSTTIPDSGHDFEQMVSELNQELQEYEESELCGNDDASDAAFLEKMELLHNKTLNVLSLLEDCKENAGLLMGLSESSEQTLSQIDEDDLKQQSISEKIHSVRKDKDALARKIV